MPIDARLQRHRPRAQIRGDLRRGRAGRRACHRRSYGRWPVRERPCIRRPQGGRIVKRMERLVTRIGATPKRRKPVRKFIVRWVGPPVAHCLYRWLGNSWHYVTENEDSLADLLKVDRPVVGAFLHARTFQLLYYFSQPKRGRWMLMCSRSSDGDVMAHVEESLGYRVA